MNRYIGMLILMYCVSQGMQAEEYYYRAYLKDKGVSEYTVEHPEAFLSKESIDRRKRQRIPVSDSDLPIDPAYLNALSAVGRIVTQSRWQSTVVVAGKDTLLKKQLERLSIVDSVKWVWKGRKTNGIEEREAETRLTPEDEQRKSVYGYAEKQLKMLNGKKLHKAGFRGEGMRVAVIDDGFCDVDRITAFDSLKLLGTKNIVYPDRSVFEGEDHGTKVLSCLAANLPGLMVGTAPAASYWLIKSEDGGSEYPIEEDYWTAAAEFADSVGVDVITTSLGYFTFDMDKLSYDPIDLDGETAFVSRTASLAAGKGILVFCSAGNEGNGRWEKITFPSDAKDIVTVGSIDEKGEKSNFSSVGFTTDNRVKPDVVALGTGSRVIDSSGNIRYANGTSFATPILAGLGICLWQALPERSNKEIIRLIQQAGHHYKTPDTGTGYGIPDMYKAYKKGRKYVSADR